MALVKLLADSKRRQDGLTGDQWQAAHDAVLAGQSLPDFLSTNVRLSWKKTAYIDGLTHTAKLFMALGAADSLGLTSTALPLSFVPKEGREVFSRKPEYFILIWTMASRRGLPMLTSIWQSRG